LDPSLPNSFLNQNFDTSIKERQIAYSLMEMVRISNDFDLKKVIVLLNLRSVNIDASDAVSDYLYDFCCGFSVLIHYFIGGWSGEFVADTPLAIERTQQLMGFRRVP